MPKRTYDIAFKKEVCEYIRNGHTVNEAVKYYSERDQTTFADNLFYHWSKNTDKILVARSSSKRIEGAGRKPLLVDLEGRILQEIVQLSNMKLKVTRSFIANRAKVLAVESNINGFRASSHWLNNFMKRNDISLKSLNKESQGIVYLE